MSTETEIVDLRVTDGTIIDKLAPLVHEAFLAHAPGWLPTVAAAKDEIWESLEPQKISRVLLDAEQNPLGWIGATPRSRGRVWEIHPMMVAVSAQGKGYGLRLMRDIEALASQCHALTLEVGTSDLTNATTLSGIDLYANPARAIADLRTLKRHPVAFYMKIGFKVVGILPDAEGVGRPAITLAKRVQTSAS